LHNNLLVSVLYFKIGLSCINSTCCYFAVSTSHFAVSASHFKSWSNFISCITSIFWVHHLRFPWTNFLQ